MNSMQEALKAAGIKKAPRTPWNPSRSAIARVTNPLPAPTVCPNCGSHIEIVNNEVIYGRQYGEWPWAYICKEDSCQSYVGMHPFTAIPLGTLANQATRTARKNAKAVFNPLWQSGRLTRTEAYVWLAGQLGIADVNECHIGWFDVTTCSKVVEICTTRKPSSSTERK